MPNPDLQLFKYQTEAKLWACGRRGEGGTVIIQDGKLSAEIELAPTSFDLLILLIEAAQRVRKEDEEWAPTGFLSAKELQREMTKQAGGTMNKRRADPEHVTKAIHRLRKGIGVGLFARRGWRSYAMRLLEKTRLGYRISTEPSNLHLVFLGA
ncbi:MAG TPA: hypothetical protein VGY53_04330 [Isosphaeraceae bacterium]|nr:hypothetical protein [Isosphaeraceae bacterium]